MSIGERLMGRFEQREQLSYELRTALDMLSKGQEQRGLLSLKVKEAEGGKRLRLTELEDIQPNKPGERHEKGGEVKKQDEGYEEYALLDEFVSQEVIDRYSGK